MSDKLARAKHRRDAIPAAAPFQPASETHTPPPRKNPQGCHAGRDKSASSYPYVDPGATAQIAIIGKHIGTDRTQLAPPPKEHQATLGEKNLDTPKKIPLSTETRRTAPPSVESSAALISACVIISRITGFLRTWVMAFALGSTLLSSSYQVANNLPNMLYELVVGGMLVTAFLPVYLSVKKKLGTDAGNAYASNLFTLVVIFLGLLSVFCMAFPSLVIYTQSFWSDQSEMAQSVFFFQFFAVQIVFYGMSSVLSGLLNANRDYLWSSIAPVANNVIVITTFLAYAFIAPHAPTAALYIIAIGNPLGVVVQMVIQLPALKRNGIKLRLYLDLHDPALRDTLSLGLPTILVMLCSFIVTSVQMAASYNFADNGPSIMYYARLWFTLPYAFLAVPITTALFTELAEMQAEGNVSGIKRGIINGTNQIIFFMIPCALYLIVFATPLVTFYRAGAFTANDIASVASYLSVFACALPFYGVNTYLQKVFSSLRKMGIFAGFNFIAGGIQIGLTVLAASGWGDLPIESIAGAEAVFFIVGDFCLFAFLRRHLGPLGLRTTAKAALSGIVLGGLGAGSGAGILWLLQTFIAPLSGSIPQAFAYVVAGGCISLIITFGLATKLRIPEAAFMKTLAKKIRRRLRK